jgi:hypothetical protein
MTSKYLVRDSLHVQSDTRMTGTGERRHDFEESGGLRARFREGAAVMIWGDGVVDGFPGTFDAVHPRSVAGLEQQLVSRVCCEPEVGRSAFVDA